MSKVIEITQAGINAAFEAEQAGINLKLTHVAIGSGAYTPSGAETALSEEKMRVPIDAGKYNNQTNQLDIAVKFTDTPAGFWIGEVGILAENPNGGDPVLAFLWSDPTDKIGYKSETDELYLSLSVGIARLNGDKIEITEANPDLSLLLQTEFDKYLLRSDVAKNRAEAGDRGIQVYNREHIDALDSRIDQIEARSDFLDHGEFPAWFAPVDDFALKIGEHPSDTNGQYHFNGGSIYLFSNKYELDDYQGDRAGGVYDLTDGSFTEDNDLLAANGAAENDLIYFWLEYDSTNPNQLRLNTSLADPGESDNMQAPTGSAIVRLGSIAKYADYNITTAQIANEDLVDKFQTLKLDCSQATTFQFALKSKYKVEFINKSTRPETYTVQVTGGKGVEANWKGVELIKQARMVFAELGTEVFEFYHRPGAPAVQLMNSTNKLDVGNIIAVASSKAPDGYLECNGAQISRTAFSDLFASIGTLYGAGDGSATFQIPDFRGEFLRGWDHGRGVDSGRNLGSSQLASMVYAPNGAGGYESAIKANTIDYTSSFDTTVVDGDYIADTAYGYRKTHAWNKTLGRVRPRNKAVMYCIKY